MTEPETKIDALYEHLWDAHGGELCARLDQSLNPRSVTTMMYDLVAELDLNYDSIVLDVGCGRGNHACELGKRFDYQVIGLDPVESNLEQARASARQEGLTERVTFKKGTMERLPFDDTTFDLVWCRAMLAHVPDLERGIIECARVLKPEAAMIVYATFETDLMEPREAARLYKPLGIVPENLDLARVEGAFKDAGLHIHSSESIGSELMEYLEERDGRNSRELMRIARMTRARERFVAELGQVQYEAALALYHWGIYQLLGKLSPSLYVLKRIING